MWEFHGSPAWSVKALVSLRNDWKEPGFPAAFRFGALGLRITESAGKPFPVGIDTPFRCASVQLARVFIDNAQFQYTRCGADLSLNGKQHSSS